MLVSITWRYGVTTELLKVLALLLAPIVAASIAIVAAPLIASILIAAAKALPFIAALAVLHRLQCRIRAMPPAPPKEEMGQAEPTPTATPKRSYYTITHLRSAIKNINDLIGTNMYSVRKGSKRKYCAVADDNTVLRDNASCKQLIDAILRHAKEVPSSA